MLGLRRSVQQEPLADSSETPEDRRPPSRKNQAITLALTLLMTAAWAVVVTVVLDASAWPDSRTALRTRVWESPTLLPSILVVWVFVLFVVALIGRLWVGLGVVTALTVLIGFVNITKLDLRNDPVYPSDVVFLRQPSFLFEMVSKSQLVAGALGLVVVVVVAWGVGRLVSRLFPHVASGLSRRGRTVVLLTRLLVVATCLALLNLATNFNEPGNAWRAAFDSTGLRWRSWDQRVNYQRNGFVAGLLFNMHVTAMKRPPGYSEAAVEEIVTRYTARAQDLNRGRTANIDSTNVVIVLSESFSNPTWLKTVKFPADPIPKTTALMKQTVSGRMLAPGFGSGTANTEYELLTGQSLSQLSPQLSTPYEQLVSKYKTYPSVVDYLKRRGHTPIAIHPFSPRMYARPSVYKAFGFEKFLTKDDMKFTGRGGGRFIDDESAFNEVLEQIKTHDEPVLTHLVTMQNHMPYGGQYDDPIMPTSGLAPNYAKLTGQYARGIARSDDALEHLLDELKKSPEPTAVVFYGDHLPPQIYPQSLVKREGELTTHQTPFLLWSNVKKFAHTDLPTTSPTQFLPKLFDALGVPLPPWYALLNALDAHVPAMDTGLVINAQDQRVRPADLDPEARKVLADYRMVMYDLSVGERWSADAMFGDTPAG